MTFCKAMSTRPFRRCSARIVVVSERAAIAALFLVATAAAEKAHAEPIAFPFGTVQNESYGSGAGAGGICAAASFVNGMTYLQNAFPTVYGNTPLATGSHTTGKAAMEDFAVNGWTQGGKTYQGYYVRGDTGGFDSMSNQLQTMIDWTESYAPRRTAYSAEAPITNTGVFAADAPLKIAASSEFPTYNFMRAAATSNDYVELDAYQYSGSPNNYVFGAGHAIDLLDITPGSSGDYVLTYQDPNYPTRTYTATDLSAFNFDGWQAINFYMPSTFDSEVVLVGAFVEAPIPEPSPFVLLGMGAISLLAYAWRRREREHRDTGRRGFLVIWSVPPFPKDCTTFCRKATILCGLLLALFVTTGDVAFGVVVRCATYGERGAS